MSTVPVLLSDGQVLLTGKSRIVYLLDGAHLGGIGGQQAATGQVCGDDIDGGAAIAGTTAYLPCLGGVIALRATRSPAAVSLLWSQAPAAAPRSSPRAWSGPSGRTACCTGSIRPPARSGSRRHRRSPTISRLRVSAPASCSLPPPTTWSPSPRPPPAPRIRRLGHRDAEHPGAADHSGDTARQRARQRHRRGDLARRHRRRGGRGRGRDRRDRLAGLATAGRGPASGGVHQLRQIMFLVGIGRPR